ncbi:ABC transporter permease [Ruminiclostridium cellobioparum]|uniref:ABC-type polysaccharide transport system, permease component n=1 Tax=Ruminiclostridium cellobioparum subsp. termitidis CT1112 TaxID=1195236 RepID=S0FLH7_RUMCE|nr:ABC transporter permease subunit [Ruminiclostridium cellobioparum]EMS73080.1 ABC-type polysaccharide transport system, permease component [Ruminiclostridium cellobioparum subsp. termitidis CT1112]
MKSRINGGFFSEIYKNKVLYLMFLPVALYFIIFAYVPMGGIILAFKEFNIRGGILFSPWNGIENFRFFFASGKAWQVTKNTLEYNVVFLACYTFFSILTAIMISEISNKWFKKIAQSFMFLPYFISWVVVAAFIYNFFNYDYGLVNTLIKNVGGQPIDIYAEPANWVILLPVLYVWKWVGFGSVLYLAAIMGIDQECYEAATIDGANMFQKITKITLPLLRPTIIVLVLMGVGRILRGEFDMFYNIIGNNGILMDATDIIDTLVFRSLMGTQDFGMASAAGFYQSVLCFVIILIVNGVVRKVDNENALF